MVEGHKNASVGGLSNGDDEWLAEEVAEIIGLEVCARMGVLILFADVRSVNMRVNLRCGN